jgi:serine/threonine protein kinase
MYRTLHVIITLHILIQDKAKLTSMNTIQTMTDDILSDYDKCPGCGAALPRSAVFCASCGERLDRVKDLTSLLQEEQDISTRYRIISLVRRYPSVNLYLALDIQASARGRMVAIRDIDISSLDEQARSSVIEQAQQEYDLLRRWQPPYVMSAIDLRYAQGHLYTVAGFAPQTPAERPVATPLVGVPSLYPADEASSEASLHGTPTRGVATESIRKDGNPRGENSEREVKENWPRLTTLQDFLQSGQGLPSEQRALQIMSYLCSAVDSLHRHQVTIGGLDPYSVILNGETMDAQPGLMISWLIPGVGALLPPKTTTPAFSYFMAPEALQGDGDARSDIYSLGAIYYLLLTGMPPEESSLRQYKRLRTPHEINPRMSLHVSESVMQALAVEPNERFQTAAAFSEALRNPRYRRPVSQREAPGEQSPDVETVRIFPLSYKDVGRWRASRAQKQAPAPRPIPPRPVAAAPSLMPDEVASVESDWERSRDSEHLPAHGNGTAVRRDPIDRPGSYRTPIKANAVPVTPGIDSDEHYATGHTRKTSEKEPSVNNLRWKTPLPSQPAPVRTAKPTRPPAIDSRSWMQRVTNITNVLPAINPRKFVGTRFTTPAQSAVPVVPALKRSPDANSWFEQLKQAVLGQQQHVIAAAAIIETPLRVLPDQLYTIRLHVMGRDQGESSAEKRRGSAASGGLSTLAHGDVALIEVRSVLQESYAYVLQMATVTIPAEGYVAEVTIPMQPLSSTPTGRRDRLHIFFLNEQRHPLYEKPFVLEIFVSHHVKRGSEGHHVLTIPV